MCDAEPHSLAVDVAVDADVHEFGVASWSISHTKRPELQRRGKRAPKELRPKMVHVGVMRVDLLSEALADDVAGPAARCVDVGDGVSAGRVVDEV